MGEKRGVRVEREEVIWGLGCVEGWLAVEWLVFEGSGRRVVVWCG